MRHLPVATASMLLLSACADLADVQKQPVRLTLTVPAAWDRTGTCIAAKWNAYETQYLPVASEQRASVIVNQVTTGALGSIKRTLFLYEINGSGGQTIVTWRRDDYIANAASEREARQIIEACGKT